MTSAVVAMSMFALVAALYYTFFDSEEDEDEDDEEAHGLALAVLILFPCALLMWYEPIFSYFAFIPSLIVIGIHCCMDVSSRDTDVDEELETEKQLENGFAYVA